MSLPDPKADYNDQMEQLAERPGGIITDFETWVQKIKPEMDHIFKILSQKLSDEPEELVRDLEDADAWNARAGYFLAEANSWVDHALYWFREDKKEGQTEFDRKIMLDGQVAYFRKVRDKIEALCNGIKQRLVLGASLLGYYRSTAEHKPRLAEFQPPKRTANEPLF